MPKRRPGPDLEVTDRGRPRTSRAFLERVVAAALDHCGRRDLPVSLLLAGDREVAALHGRHLGDPSPTDVLSFELDGGAEVAVSVECAARVAREHGHPVRAEVALYVVHGILHVCGFDDTNARARARMRRAERDVLEALGLVTAPVDGDVAAAANARRTPPRGTRATRTRHVRRRERRDTT